MIQRDLEKRLIAHLTHRVEHPNVALLEGARQVGKTTLVESIRPKLAREMLYLNLEENNRAVHDLSSCRDFADFETYLATTHQFKGDGQRVLCIDEAQEAPALGGFVRFMKEKWQHTPVILTGSSMTRIFGRETRFPVGRVTRFLLQPFSFKEFLRCGKRETLLAFEDPFQIPLFLHERLLKYVQAYLDVGGLPAVASSFFAQQDWRQIRRDLYFDYRSDFARIFSETEASLFDQCLRGVASSGYTMCFPVPGTYAQMQSNLAATLNIDWLLDLMRDVLAMAGVEKGRAELLPRVDALAFAAEPGTALYHPYISAAGERGPFLAPEARASFTGLDTGTGLAELTRAVIEGLAFAARDCYTAMGEVPGEIRLTGGGARSEAMRAILAAVLDRPVHRVEREEAGAAGAAMIATVQQGLYPDMAACAAEWVAPRLGPAQLPDPSLSRACERLFPVYTETRAALAPVWGALAAARGEPGP